jgi:hypothetical protein
MARLLNTKANIDGSKLKVTWEECNTHKYGSTATSGAGVQYGSHMNISLQFFFSNEPYGKIYARNAVLGPLFTSINAEKQQFENQWMRK